MCTNPVHIGSIFILSMSILLSCKSMEENNISRPSPLRTDSLRLSTGKITITYSSPAVRKREIWGKLDPYYKVWRIGANDATIFENEMNLRIMDSMVLPKGKYSVFAIPREGDWTIIFNKEWEQWGAYNYDEGKDQLRFDVGVYFEEDLRERLNFEIQEDALNFSWEYLRFNIPFEVN